MDKIEDSLQDLEKAKQELLHKLKELEKLEDTVKKQIEPKEDSEQMQDSAAPSPTQEPAQTPPTQETPIPNKEKPGEQIVQDPNTEQQKVETQAEPTPSKEQEEQAINQTVSTEPTISETQPEPVSENEKNTEETKKETISPEPEKTESASKETKNPIAKKPEKIKATPEDKSKSKASSKINKKVELEKSQIQNYNVSTSNRLKGKNPAEPGNKGIKHTPAEVFIFVVDDNELQLKVLQEQFKNTKSFKKTKGFTNGADLLSYIKDKKFPRHSILLVIMDYFLEDSDDEESQNGIAILNQLKEYDPNIEVIMLSSHSDVDIATSSSYFGAVTFIQKGQDAFKKIINNLIWAIHQQEKIRKKAETKRVIKIGLIVFISFLLILIVIDAATNALHLYDWPWFLEEVAPTTVAPPE
ncbi:MAG: response regulator [Bacteroidales bacterium]|jgi:FixJ family two-component response regulator|nr:response regulator [Bacteroidales bacterium]